MRRTFAISAVALSLAAAVLTASPSSAQDEHIQLQQTRPAAPAAASADPTAAQALAAAQDLLTGQGAAQRRTAQPVATRDATMVLRDLQVAMPQMSSAQRAQARQLLARPTADRSKCAKHVCVHWSSSGTDRTKKTWATKTLQQMSKVWAFEVGKMGFRAPLEDGGHGGNGKLDVYLSDLGAQGLYGYCSREYQGPTKRTATAYCALDNDFSKAQFGARPITSLRVTAAHEFFHAVQFAYDSLEDKWVMEATATWMEERYADSANDNRQYLPAGQLIATSTPLDYFDSQGAAQYGQWIFFEYLQKKFGKGVVKRLWQKLPGKKHYSVKMLDKLPGSFKKQYAGFVAANITAGRSYAEGSQWPKQQLVAYKLGRGFKHSTAAQLYHLTAVNMKVKPKKTLDTKKWHLKLRMDGPRKAAHPMLVVVWHGKDHELHRSLLGTNRQGVASKVVSFNRRTTRSVTVSLVNASTRYTCQQHTSFACAGTGRDDGKTFELKVKVIKKH